MKTWKLDIETKVRYDINNGAKREESVYWIKEDPVTPNNVVAIVTGNSTQDAIKNGHLLAAAPEMIEALEAMAEMWATQGWFQEGSQKTLDDAYAVIRKARGES